MATKLKAAEETQPAPVAAPRLLLERLNAVQQEVDYVQKEKRAGMRYSIVSHDAVTAKVRPILVKHGVLYYPIRLETTQVGNRTQAQMTVRFVSVDNPTDFIDVPTFGYGIDEQDKGPGKAMSYAVKYALLKTLGLETGDDPDVEQDVEFHEKEPGKPTGAAAEPRAAENKPDPVQAKKDVAYIEGLIVRIEAARSKDALMKLHKDTSEQRLAVRERDEELHNRYLVAMKERADDLDAPAATDPNE